MINFHQPVFLRHEKTIGWEAGPEGTEHYWANGLLIGSVAQDSSTKRWGVRMSYPKAEEDRLLTFKTKEQAKKCAMTIFMAWVGMNGVNTETLTLSEYFTAKADLRKLGLLTD